MIRATLLAIVISGSLAGPVFAAGGGAEESKPEGGDDPFAPVRATWPGSYVALPQDVLTRMRNKILEQRGETPDGAHDEKKAGGH